MNIDEIKVMLINLCSDVFNDAGVDSDLIEYVDTIDDLGMDSLTFITLIVNIEETFGIIIPDELLVMEEFRKFNDILNIIFDLLLKETECKDGEYNDKT